MRFIIIAGFAGSLLNFRGPLLQALQARGHEVHAAAPGLGAGSVEAEQLRKMGIIPHDVPMDRTGLTPLADLRLLVALARLMRRLHPDAMMGYTVKPVIWGTLAAWLARVPRRVALITGLGLSFNEGKGAKQRLLTALVSGLYRAALKRAETVVFQNRDDLALFRDRTILSAAAQTRVVDGSGIDLDRFARAPLPDGPLRFVLVARMIASKGVREFAEAARRTRECHPQVQFDLIGGLDSNPDSVTADEIDRWQAEQVLTWHGQVADVRPLMQAAHVVVLPSYYREGVPRSLLEALALGRLIITTDMPGCRETLDGENNGILVPPRDAAALAQAMDKLASASCEELLKMSEASHRLAKQRFDVHRVNRDMIAVIEGETQGA
ncbi:glycosyltransferase family 4 protein [Sphingorhabdus sp. SMR4y]|uniref:glycosyltransferase family 4 protein n=1 Tax=Sphingorhabdus sp. SMR4y TaxID=2584094 RepID=UPI000B5C7A10|nr:glycosyltransferase family 4 protein [Sphingorhabdus sp. SMR4y]ASK89166.1 N, N'-diacetylbacillosaminyl-diphospho-undecaprenol alpha-1,3-N-acetylgalactosaminyltransferase [Sphingorhabdus sp. SMR4y]